MSTEVTTEMMNEAIALFINMELKQDMDDPGFEWEWVNAPKGLHWPSKTPPPFHTSWDWLMPVVVRIKNDESLRLRAPCLGILDSIWPYINAMKYMNQRLLKVDITGTHAGVYQFITWYNQQKQTNG